MAAEGDLLWARYRADTGETAQAIEQIGEAMPVIRRTYPALSIQRWTPAISAAHVFDLAGRFADAESYAREALAAVDALPSPEVDPRRAQTLFELGTALEGEKKYPEAASVFERAGRIYAQMGPAWAVRGEQVRKKLSELPARNRRTSSR
jgi:tetratricopeptide (TPR) repeat protein